MDISKRLEKKLLNETGYLPPTGVAKEVNLRLAERCHDCSYWAKIGTFRRKCAYISEKEGKEIKTFESQVCDKFKGYRI